ncbi:MAG: glycerol-3-phosphate dehydrogenase/oxidase [Bdellovibrionales bacterium]|nr:glycerol-3-phosphate dehydrogenase/oxidase [Oligoflexia bacterium]
MQRSAEFSHKTRTQNLNRLETEEFDFLVIGGGITGAGVAWDAASRGYKVALVEKSDYAHGTSSRSSKLVHGGLRYLENYEFHMVHESLTERSFLLRSAPHLVRPLPFYMPVYEDSPHSSYLLSAGMWLYDVLSLFRAPSLHQRLSAGTSTRIIPGIKREGLVCTFKYYDASMWDDALVIDVLVRAHELGACITSRTKAVEPGYDAAGNITEMTIEDEFTQQKKKIRFKKLIVCAGVWTDEVGKMLDKGTWHDWLAPSRGVHLVFDWKRIPVPGAVTMQIGDGRIAFVIPRHDYGQGITIVGTTDGPTTLPPDQIEEEGEAIAKDQAYLLELLSQYFPTLKLSDADVINHYIGIRPLVNPKRNHGSSSGNLQKVSREHTIDQGPGGSVIVAGGKYTTFRKMAEEIVDFATKGQDHRAPKTETLLFAPAHPEKIRRAREVARSKAYVIPEKIFERYGADAIKIYQIHISDCDQNVEYPEGFPLLEAQFRYAVRHQMVLTVEDFVRRRQPLHLCRQDHGAPWYPLLEKALKDELATSK